MIPPDPSHVSGIGQVAQNQAGGYFQNTSQIREFDLCWAEMSAGRMDPSEG